MERLILTRGRSEDEIMKKNWFEGLNSPQEIKNMYRELAFEYHPDKGGKTEVMQEINTWYHRSLKKCDNIEFGEYKYSYDWKRESDLADKIVEVVNIEGVTVELCGIWLWITGETYPHRVFLKNLGFKYSGNKKAWYYHRGVYRKQHNRTFTMYQIRESFGSKVLSDEQEEKKQINA